jgi:hypothetical protein
MPGAGRCRRVRHRDRRRRNPSPSRSRRPCSAPPSASAHRRSATGRCW